MMDMHGTVRKMLGSLLDEIWKLEEKAIVTEEFSDISDNDFRVIEAIGTKEGNNMSMIAKKLNITVGSLTTAMNSLVNKKYVARERSEEDRRVVYIRLTLKGKKAHTHLQKFRNEMTEAVLEGLTKEDIEGAKKIMENLKAFLIEHQQ